MWGAFYQGTWRRLLMDLGPERWEGAMWELEESHCVKRRSGSAPG